MLARIKALEEFGRKFSNRREWRDFVSAVQCSVNYPRVLNALRAGGFVFNDTAAAPTTASPVLRNELLK